jgi:hypothetical protein
VNHLTKISCLFLICSSVPLDSRRNGLGTRSSAATESKLDTVNTNLAIVAASLSTLIAQNSAIANNTSATAINTAGNGGSVASMVVLKNLSGANHNGVGTHWDHPLNITPATVGNVFKFSENIVFSTVANITAESAAIVVGKDNVTIDLAGQTLSTTITGNFVHGIFIKPGIKGTQIISSTQNVNNKGIIQDFKGYGIYIAGSSGATVKNTSIDNISCAYNSKGLHAEYTNDISITNSNFIANTSPSVLVHGIYMANIKNAFLNNVKANANNSSVANAFGIYLENATNSTIEHSFADLNFSAGAGPSSAYGIYITSTGSSTSSSNKIVSCTANENYFSGNGANQEAVGILLTSNGGTTTSNIIANCTTQRNVFTATGATNPAGYGIKTAGAVNNEIRGCTSSYNANVGIIDTATNSSTNTYHSNTCTKNGPGGLTNYSVSFVTEPLKVLRVQFRDYMGIHNALSAYANIETVD